MFRIPDAFSCSWSVVFAALVINVGHGQDLNKFLILLLLLWICPHRCYISGEILAVIKCGLDKNTSIMAGFNCCRLLQVLYRYNRASVSSSSSSSTFWVVWLSYEAVVKADTRCHQHGKIHAIEARSILSLQHSLLLLSWSSFVIKMTDSLLLAIVVFHSFPGCL